MSDLPEGYRNVFRLEFVPYIRYIAGLRGPWEQLTPTDIGNCGGDLFGDGESQLGDDLIGIISKLVRTVYVW
jgi:hypothetical protein